MNRIAVFIVLAVLAIIGTPFIAQGYTVDSPHNESNGIYCFMCHNNSAWWWGDPNNGTGDINVTTRNTICLSCHDEQENLVPGPSVKEAPVSNLHASSTTSNIPGTDPSAWSTQCTDCHDPHAQTQLDWAYTDPASFWLADGDIDFVIAPQVYNVGDPDGQGYGATTVGISFLYGQPGWADPLTWSYKGGRVSAGSAVDNSRGLVFVPNKSNPTETFEVINVVEDIPGFSYILKVKGQMTSAQDLVQFGVFYGQNLKASVINPTTLLYNSVKFFQPDIVDGTYGGWIDDTLDTTTPQGLCQVCHAATSYWNSDGSNPTHNDTTNCSDCHNHLAGFKSPLPPPSLEVTVNQSAKIAGSGDIIIFDWTTDGTNVYVEKLDEQGVSIGAEVEVFGGSNSDNPNQTTIYRFRAWSGTDSTFKNVTITVLDPASLGVAILTPQAEDIINKPVVNVSGLVTTGVAEVGVIVNGVVAIIDGNEFFANNVPLNEGLSTIEAIATEPGGSSVSYSIEVLVDTIDQEWILLGLNPATGVAPLDTTLTIDHHLDSPLATIGFNCVSDPIASCASLLATLIQISESEYDFTIADPGIYTISYIVTDQEGPHSQDIMIQVLDSVLLDSLLINIWDDTIAALLLKDVPTATSYFTSQTQALYNDIFNELYDTLPQIAAEIQQQEFEMGGSIQMVSVKNDRVKYRITRDEVHAGPTGPTSYPISYYIYFVVDENGLWKIYKF